MSDFKFGIDRAKIYLPGQDKPVNMEMFAGPDDERWEGIKAYMGPKVEFRGDEFDQGINLDEWYEITFEMNWDGMYWWQFQVFHKDDWESFSDPKIINWILDQMVELMDERLAEHESRAEATPEEGAGEAR